MIRKLIVSVPPHCPRGLPHTFLLWRCRIIIFTKSSAKPDNKSKFISRFIIVCHKPLEQSFYPKDQRRSNTPLITETHTETLEVIGVITIRRHTERNSPQQERTGYRVATPKICGSTSKRNESHTLGLPFPKNLRRNRHPSELELRAKCKLLTWKPCSIQ